MERQKTFFLVSYDFPPIGGGGVQRNVKFLKYLDKLGWRTEVLTVKERDFYVFDHTLLNEIPNTIIHKSSSLDPVSLSFTVRKIFKRFAAKSKVKSSESETTGVNESSWYVSFYRFIRNWFLIPDGFGLWIPLALRKGLKAIRSNRPDILYATFPHPSNALLTYKLHKKSGVPLVIDFRDGWMDDPYVTFPSLLHLWYHRHWERKVINVAKAIIVYGDPLKIALEERYPFLKAKIHSITNGFDPEDFEGLQPILPENGKREIVYSGAVYLDRRETFTTFIKALAMLTPEEKAKLSVVFVGDQMQWSKELVLAYQLDAVVKFTGYLPHKEALNYLAGADAALMFLKAGDVVALTGKIFEYLGLGLPIIACVEPAGACSKLLASIRHNQGVCPPDKPDLMLKVLRTFLKDGLPALSSTGMKVFSRKHHTEELDRILTELLE